VETIRSRTNPLVKRVRAVRRGKEAGVLLEGPRLCEEALDGGLRPRVLLVTEASPQRAEALVARGYDAHLVAVELFGSLGSLTTPPDVLGVFDLPRRRELAELPDAPGSLLAVSAGLQDPGNLGGLARSAEALGASALVVLPDGCRPWNEKAMCGSMGSLLRFPVFEPATEELLPRLDELGYRHVVARTRDGVSPAAFDWSGRVALWVTAETGLLPASVQPHARTWDAVTIPMAGAAESLNVAVAASILLFAAARVGAKR